MKNQYFFTQSFRLGEESSIFGFELPHNLYIDSPVYFPGILA